MSTKQTQLSATESTVTIVTSTITKVSTMIVAVILVAAGCSPGGDNGAQGRVDQSAGPNTQLDVDDPLAQGDDDDSTDPSSTPAPSTGLSLSDRIVDLGPADGIPAPPVVGPRPTSVSVERIGVESATVLAVGVEDNGEMEIPPPLEVGWYEYGPSPGETGSAVLAGHIASDGIDGAFRHLDRVEVDDTVEVGHEDGSVSRFRVTAVEQYEKFSLPFDTVFAEEGDPQLVLVTCGGPFDHNLRSYEDNVVVYAVPLA